MNSVGNVFENYIEKHGLLRGVHSYTPLLDPPWVTGLWEDK